jgi:hypothetical protein
VHDPPVPQPTVWSARIPWIPYAADHPASHPSSGDPDDHLEASEPGAPLSWRPTVRSPVSPQLIVEFY